MKKAISIVVCLAMIAAVGVAQAATVYEKDGLTFKVAGDWQLQLRQEHGQDKEMDIEYDDLEIKNTIEYDLGNDLTAFGQLDFGFKDAADQDGEDNPELEEAYLGFKIQNFTIAFGATGNAADEFGVEGSKETYVASDAFDAYGATSGDDLIKASFENDMFFVVASYEIAAESEDRSDETFADIYAQVTYMGFTLGAAYQNIDKSPHNDDDEDGLNIWGVSASYDAKFVQIAADYSVNVADEDDSNADDASVFNVYVSVPINTLTLGVGFQGMALEDDEDTDADVNGYYVHAIYQFPAQKNVSVFAEVGGNDYDYGDDDDNNIGFLLGMRVQF